MFQETICTMFIFSRNKRKKEIELDKMESYKNDLLCRFVLDGAGRKIGESVALDDDILIIKSGNKYLGVPLVHIEDAGKTLLVKGLVEQDKAELMGEKWRRESFKDLNYKEEEKDGV
ncbi:MAG: hypothetical protein QHH15_02150 [Candidatus Thermoplasmatota archaeon]|jgi:hypothetical protein|nr:hypothetical protein [Candidatus Thermoplasmatota archaeon]